MTATDILDTPEAGPAAIRGAAIRIVGYVVGVVLSLASATLLLRYLGAGRFGQYVTVFSLMTIVMTLTEAGTTQIGIREYAVREAHERRGMLASLQGLRIALTILGVLLALGFTLVAGYTDAQVLGTLVYGAGLVVTVYAMTLFVPLQAELRLTRVTALELIRQAATVAVLIVLVVAGGGVALLLATPIPVGVVLVVASVAVAGASGRFGIAADREEWRRLLAETLPYTAAVAIGIVYSYVTVLLMSLVATDVETGYFGAAHRIFIVLAAIPGLIVATAFPVLARAAHTDRGRLRYAIQRLFEMQLAVGTGLAIVTIAAAPAALDVLGGGEYGPSVPVMRLLGLALITTSLVALGGFALLSLKRYGTLMAANALALLVTSVLTLVLASDGGAEGAGVALIIGEVVLATTYFVALGLSGELWPSLGVVPRVAVAAGAAVVPGFVLGLPSLVAATLAGLVYAAVAVLVRAVPREALEAFTARLPGRRDEAAARTPPPSVPS